MKLQPIISLLLAGWSAATVSCGKESSLLFRRSFLSHTLLMPENLKTLCYRSVSSLLMSCCCSSGRSPTERPTVTPSGHLRPRHGSITPRRSKCKGSAAGSPRCLQHDQKQRSFHVLMEISSRGLLLWSVLLETSTIRAEGARKQGAPVKYDLCKHLRAPPGRTWTSSHLVCRLLRMPCCCLILDHELINDNSCCFQEREQPGWIECTYAQLTLTTRVCNCKG